MSVRFAAVAGVSFLGLAFATACGGGDPTSPTGDTADAQKDSCAYDTEAVPWAGLSATDGTYKVAIQSDPPVPMLGDSDTSWTLNITDGAGNPIPDGTKVSVLCTMTHVSSSHGCAVTPQTKQMAVGVYEAKPIIFNMAGHWQMDISVGPTADVKLGVCLE
jgi:hypothetical protein